MNTNAAMRGQAEKALSKALSGNGGDLDWRFEVDAKNGTLLLFEPLSEKKDDPLHLLRQNAEGYWAPVVLDPETGRPAHRRVIAFRIWCRPERLHAFLADPGGQHGPRADCGSLRLLRGVPAGAREFNYGRSGRLAMLLERRQPFLAARVFPGGMVESSGPVPESLLTHMARVLLARSGVSARPHVFHLLRGKHFLQAERAADLPIDAGSNHLKALEVSLVKGAEEDRKILSAMLAAGLSPERLYEREFQPNTIGR